MSKKQRRKTGADKSLAKQRRSRALLGYAVPAFLCAALIAFFVYWWIDLRVRKEFLSADTETPSAVYSEATSFPRGVSVNCNAVSAALKNRAYLQTTSAKLPGEFTRNGMTFEVITRDGGKRVTFNCESGETSGSDSLSLEPVPLAPLGRTEFRASSYRTSAQIPKSLHDAIIAIEDRRFYKHHGIDVYGIIRAMAANIRAMRLVQGGSTLTQQLAKNTLFSSRKTWGRKFLELFAAFSIEQHLTKDQIFERYCNEIYLGQEGPISIHGVQEAARSFFGKDLKDISLGQAAMLAGIIQAPSAYSPRRHLKLALERRDVVLKTMREADFITDTELDKALKEKIQVVKQFHHQRIAPYFVASVTQILNDKYDIDTEASAGLKVYTGLNLEMQQCAEAAVIQGRKRLEASFPLLRRKHKPIEIALVALDPKSGVVKAWVGGVDYGSNQFDHVSQAKRQIGSTIKPFLYLTALDPTLNSYKAATTISILSDEPTGIKLFSNKTWTPENYDKQFRGDVTLRYALEHSLNVPAVYVAERVGIPALVKTVHRFSLANEVPEVPALALGALDSSLLSMTTAFGALANRGVYTGARQFLEVTGSSDKLLAQTEPLEQRIVDEGPVYVLTDILRGVIERGTAAGIRKMGFNRIAAGKTGTSNEARDAWFIGYTPSMVAGVWTGFDDNSPTGTTGASASAPVWADFMKCIDSSLTDENFTIPPSVTSVTIDPETRKRVTPDCPVEPTVDEIFLRGTEPLEDCPL
jgi:penicillin-binding protein 1B